MDYYPVETLNEAIEAVRGEKEPFERGDFYFKETAYPLDFSEVKGQSLAKRGMEIAAAGFHNILLMGSPGVGKTMLAKRLPGIMPMLSMEEAIDVTRIYSVAPGKSVYQKGLITQRPFRSPHHTSSEVSITGGGSIPKPGEVSLAHHGILFLDELPEFKRNVFEVLREPLEEKQITVSRSEKVQTFPADFVLVAAMNPCPCGYAFHPVRSCQCNANQVKNYLRKVSGPILDRIDLQIQMAEVAYKEIERKEESSETVRQRVLHAIEKQKERQGKWNSTLSTGEIEKYCVLSASSRSLIRQAMERLGFSMRGYTKVLKIARTVADLAGADSVGEEHLLEALQFRSLEKQFGTVFQI
jgi:magnesium chelatase family protein